MFNFDAKGFAKDMAISVTSARKAVQVQTLDRLLKDGSISKENYDKHLAIVMQEFGKSVDLALGFKGWGVSEDVQKLLMMFINDAYSNSGKVKKLTALKTMKFVEKHPELQRLVNAGDEKSIAKFRL